MILLSLIFILSGSGLIYAQDVDDIVLTHQISTSDSQPSIDISQDTLSSQIDEISYNNDSDLGTTKNECVDRSDASSANEQNSLINPQEDLSLNSNLKLSEYYVNQNSIMFDGILGVSNNDDVLGYDHTYDVPISAEASQYLSQFKYVSSGLYIDTSHTLSVFWTPIINGDFYVVFDMHDGYIIKSQKGVNGLSYTNMDISQIATKVNLVKFSGVTNPSSDVSITLQRTGGPHVTISGIYAYYPTETSLTINGKLSDTVNVNTPVTLKPTVTSDFTTIGSNGVVNYYVKGPGESAFTKLSQTSNPTGSITYTPQTKGDYTFYAEYQENENDHLFGSNSNEVTLKVNPSKPTVGISVTSVTYPNRAVATITTNAPGTYSVVINGKSYSLTFSSSQTSRNINVDLLPPHLNYDASVSFGGNSEWAAASASTTFSI